MVIFYIIPHAENFYISMSLFQDLEEDLHVLIQKLSTTFFWVENRQNETTYLHNNQKCNYRALDFPNMNSSI